MSKQLIKILVICAVVVLCPLVIVAVALLSTEAVGCSLTINGAGIEKVGETDFGGKSSIVKIMINGQEQQSNEVEVTKNDEVTVTFEGVGYDFVGWYNGNYNEINFESDEKLSDQTSYTFKITKNTVLTAVRNVKTYNVSYKGNFDDENTPIATQGKTYAYNEPLAVENAVNEKNVLAGWYNMNGESAGATTKVANFENSGNVKVYPKWERQYQFYFVGVADYIYNEISGTWTLKATKGEETDQYVIQEPSMMYFMENPTPGYNDLNQDVCDYFLSQYSDIKSMNGDNVEFTNTIQILYKTTGELAYLAAEVDLADLNDGELSFGDVLEYVRTAQGSLQNVSYIDITYVFDIVA